MGIFDNECHTNHTSIGYACTPDASDGAGDKYGNLIVVFVFIAANPEKHVCRDYKYDHAYLESGKAMGMTKLQLLRMVELPLSLSVIMAGLRTALVVAIGVTAVGTFVGAGGLGDIIVRGTNASNGTAIILAGAIPTALMAILSDLLLGWLERILSPIKKKKVHTA